MIRILRDDQAQRYARHLQLPGIGGLGQTAIMVAHAKLALREPDPRAELVAAQFLAAAGVGTLVITNATSVQRADVAAHAPDTRVISESEGAHEGVQARAKEREVSLAPRPEWWPSSGGDDLALAYFRGGLAAIRFLIDAAAR
ncbi:MAG: hypothetical protein ABI467_21485 [Kofleriaceae bacterium]